MAGIARAHSFTQGNKRTCFIAMVQFLKVNGYDLSIEDSQPWVGEIIALVEHRSGEEDFVRAVLPFVVAIE
jgi:prophage maintenance system killer protein